MIGLMERAQAEAACKIVNRAIAIDGDPFTLAGLLAWIGARIMQVTASSSDLQAYALQLRALADLLEREEPLA